MNKVIKHIIDNINNKAEETRMNSDDAWLEKIPSKPGWYLIKTNASIEVLNVIGSPKYTAHIDIPKTIKETLQLNDIAIKQVENKPYVVYNGEAKSLRARAREHIKGHEKTYCLGLNDYDNLLKNYNWTFCYVAISNYKDITKGGNKILRLAVEQAWRVENGWPILCKK